MDPLCPRCHAQLASEANFCHACGSPQLTVERPEPENEDELPSGGGYALSGPQIAWPTAITSAAMLAVPVGLLSSLVSFSTVWVIAGSIWTTIFYRRRTSTGLNPLLGSRIGCVFGIFAAIIATCADASNLLFRRYGLHHGTEIDSQLRAAMQAGIDRVVASNPEAAHEIPWFFHFWLSPHGQAALVLTSAILSAASMLGFSALGGALGARYFMRPRS